MTPFCVVGTPRSRTTWFSRFLSHGDIHCAHEPSKLWSTDADIGIYFRPGFGAADSMLTLKWPQLLAAGVKLVAVVRPTDQVVASCLAAGLLMPEPTLAILRRIEAWLELLPPDVPRYAYAELTPAACAEIFERCAEYQCPPGWTDRWCDQSVQPNIPDIYREVATNIDGFVKLYNIKGF